MNNKKHTIEQDTSSIATTQVIVLCVNSAETSAAMINFKTHSFNCWQFEESIFPFAWYLLYFFPFFASSLMSSFSDCLCLLRAHTQSFLVKLSFDDWRERERERGRESVASLNGIDPFFAITYSHPFLCLLTAQHKEHNDHFYFKWQLRTCTIGSQHATTTTTYSVTWRLWGIFEAHTHILCIETVTKCRK